MSTQRGSHSSPSRFSRIPALAFAALFLTACSLTPRPSSDLTVTDADAGKSVTLNRGQTLVLTLSSNPTTGYSWTVVSGTGDVLTQEGEPVYKSTSRPGITGGGGIETFRFRGAAAGQTTLTLGYRRPWETGISPIQTYTLSVTVR